MHADRQLRLVMRSLFGVFLLLAVCFTVDLWGKLTPVRVNPLVDPQFINASPVRKSYADLKAAGEDLSDFDCYACHEKGQPPPLRFDTNHNLIIPEEHQTIVMAHGTHNRNNNCFNCHDEQNLEFLQTRDGVEVAMADSPRLCGSCHGPTFRDWEAGVHGRTSGSWNRDPADFKRLNCVSCHDPHAPRFPGWKPAPGPNPLRADLEDRAGRRPHI